MSPRLLTLFLCLSSVAVSALAAEPAVSIKPMWVGGLPEGMPEYDEGLLKWGVFVQLTAPAPATVHITVQSYAGGTATPNVDYIPLNETLEFLPGETAGKFAYLWVKGDILGEGEETIYIRALQNGEGRGSVVARIADDDPRPLVSIADASTVEVTSSFAVFRIQLDRKAKGPVSMSYATSNGTALAGSDYQSTTGTITIPAGDLRYDLPIAVFADKDIEPDETFTVRLSDPVGIAFTRSVGTATIVNDDVPAPRFELSPVRATEGDESFRYANFQLRLATASTSIVRATVQTNGRGTAEPGRDYEPLAESVTFMPGITEADVRIKIFGDTEVEDDERIEVTVIEDGAVRITGSLYILDDDRNVTMSVADVAVREADTGAVQASFEITLSKPTIDIVRVRYQTVAGTAAQTDFVAASGEVQFAPGVTSRVVVVNVRPDELRENAETFTLELSSPVAATIADGVAVCTITDDDSAKRRTARH
jgi:hypothetical protein